MTRIVSGGQGLSRRVPVHLSLQNPLVSQFTSLPCKHMLCELVSKSPWLQAILGKGSNNQNGNLRWHLPLGARPPPPLMAKFPDIFLPHFFSFAIESYIYETDFTLDPNKEYRC